MTDWLELANSEPAESIHPMEHIAAIHSEFERIHPLRGNAGACADHEPESSFVAATPQP